MTLWKTLRKLETLMPQEAESISTEDRKVRNESCAIESFGHVSVRSALLFRCGKYVKRQKKKMEKNMDMQT